jgi:hypothetical protein
LTNKGFALALAAFACLGTYLFATAPPPLEEERASSADIPVAEMLAAIQDANKAVRALWTSAIVADGTRAGLKFDEHWRDADLDAGPLPALFLRETARSLERHPVQLSLFLGSDFPINKSNAFEAMQLERLRMLRQTGEPQFFFMADTGLHTGMFADIAVVEACVRCHNDHEESPKHDWRLNDVMGAVTWAYPAEAVTIEEFLYAIAALHQGVREAYEEYLRKAEGFAHPPEIGERWPKEGYFLPSAEVFMAEAYRRTAPQTLAVLAAKAGP